MSASELDHRWKKLKVWARANLEWVCSLCGRPIYREFKYPHPQSWSLDHIIPLNKGGAPYDKLNVAPAHFGCNCAKQDRDSRPPRTTIDW